MDKFSYPNVPSGEPSTWGKSNRELIEQELRQEEAEAPAEEAAEGDESGSEVPESQSTY